MARCCALTLLAIALFAPAAAAAEESPLRTHPFSILPFVLMLLAIAIFPLFFERFWHSNLRKLFVALGMSLPIVLYLGWLELGGEPGVRKLGETLIEYVQFMILLGSLYTVCGGILIRGLRQPTVATNAGILLGGAVLANLIGTTGASMLLIRPMLRMNVARKHHHHIPVFFIFLVSNLGGLLTPLGDPPLFLGFLRGVDFFWTLGLWKHWLVVVGTVLAVFIVWDRIAFAREPDDASDLAEEQQPFALAGGINFLFLAGILAAVLLQSDRVAGLIGLTRLSGFWGATAMVAMAVLSLVATPKALRIDNDFAWGAIIEVAVLFLGIFITMVPALALLEQAEGRTLGLDAPWKYFWLSGLLSSFLDNAPTYLTFATIAAEGESFSTLLRDQPLILQAISAGAVFMGANTYIGNGPNFMVKALADAAGYRTPSFFGYMLYSGAVLIPTFVIITLLFFRP